METTDWKWGKGPNEELQSGLNQGLRTAALSEPPVRLVYPHDPWTEKPIRSVAPMQKKRGAQTKRILPTVLGKSKTD